MFRDYGVYLEDIAEAARRIKDYTESFTFDDFVTDQKTFDAVVRNIEIIGEATKSIPEDIRQLEPGTFSFMSTSVSTRKLSGTLSKRRSPNSKSQQNE